MRRFEGDERKENWWRHSPGIMTWTAVRPELNAGSTWICLHPVSLQMNRTDSAKVPDHCGVHVIRMLYGNFLLFISRMVFMTA